MKKWMLYVLCCLGGFYACSSPSQELPEVTLSYKDPTTTLKFSELVDSIQIIRLETTDSILMATSDRFCIGEKYIIVESSDAIHQLGKDGKYIRKMLNKGRGPEEYHYVASFCIDDEKDRYFMTDDMGDFFSYDLKEGELLLRKKLPSPMSILKYARDTLFCYPSELMNRGMSTRIFYTLNPQGEVIQQAVDSLVVDSPFSLNYCLATDGSAKMKYKSDTVYTIENFKMTPAFSIRGEYVDHRFPLLYYLNNETPAYYFFWANSIFPEYKEDGRLASISVISNEQYRFRVNKKDFRSEKIEGVYMDTLDININFMSLSWGTKNNYFVLSAYQFHEIFKKRAEKGPLSPELDRLFREVKEDDNPLLVVGYRK